LKALVGHRLLTWGQACPGRHGGRISQQQLSGIRGGLGVSGGAGGGDDGHLAQSGSQIRTCDEPRRLTNGIRNERLLLGTFGILVGASATRRRMQRSCRATNQAVMVSIVPTMMMRDYS